MNTRFKWLLLVLLFAAPAYAQNVRVDNVTFSSVQGFPFLPGATITICTAAGTGLPCTPTVAGTCLSISDTICNQSAAITSDTFGNYGFWIQPGSYTYSITKAGFGGFGPKPLTLSCQPASTCTTTGPQSFSNVTSINSICNVTATQTLAACVTQVGSSGTIEVTAAVGTISGTGVTIPAGVTLRVDQGALISGTPAINGTLLPRDTAGTYQVFATGAAPTFGVNSGTVLSSWFASPFTDTQLTSMMAAAITGPNKATATPGTYTISTNPPWIIAPAQNFVLEGHGVNLNCDWAVGVWKTCVLVGANATLTQKVDIHGFALKRTVSGVVSHDFTSLAAPSAPTVAAVSGGNLGATVTVNVIVTYITPQGETGASAASTATTSGTCPGSGNCSIQVTSPGASSPATAYEVYAVNGASPAFGSYSLQNTYASPINLGTNFTFGTGGQPEVSNQGPPPSTVANATGSVGIEFRNVQNTNWDGGIQVSGFQRGIYLHGQGQGAGTGTATVNLYPNWWFDNCFAVFAMPDPIPGQAYVAANNIIGGQLQSATDSYNFTGCHTMLFESRGQTQGASSNTFFGAKLQNATVTNPPEDLCWCNADGNQFQGVYIEGFNKHPWLFDNSGPYSQRTGLILSNGANNVGLNNSFRNGPGTGTTAQLWSQLVSSRGMTIGGGSGCNSAYQVVCPAGTDPLIQLLDVNGNGNKDISFLDSGRVERWLLQGGGQTTQSGLANAQLFYAGLGNICTNGELVLSAGWGTSPTVTAVASFGGMQSCKWTITSGTGTPTANPTITDTYTNGFPATVLCRGTLYNPAVSGAVFGVEDTTPSSSSAVFTVYFTPATSTAYRFERTCGP